MIYCNCGQCFKTCGFEINVALGISPKNWINASAFMIEYIYGHHCKQLSVVLVTVGVLKTDLVFLWKRPVVDKLPPYPFKKTVSFKAPDETKKGYSHYVI